MRSLVYSFILCTISLLLAGCDPSVYRHYQYTPPDNSQGHQCATQCSYAKTSCERLCMLRNPSCRRKAESQAKPKYEAYVRARQANGLSIKKRLEDFETADSCKNACHCLPAFNTCYTACGGQVF